MKIGMVSLGCPKNLGDSEVMLGAVEKHSFEITPDPAEADVIIVNTCGFIESAKQESIDTILSMAEYKKTGRCRRLIVTGCLAQRYSEDLLSELPEVDAIVGTNVFKDIVEVIRRTDKGERVLHMKDGDLEISEKEGESLNVPEPRRLATPPYMAYLKIAEGCDNCCSYCAIPMIRGPYTSKPYEKVLAEARELAQRGVKELIVVAQDTTRYGEDLYGRLRLPELLKDLCAIEGFRWIRVMYMYPNNFTDELINAFATLPKLCRYVDLPLQHASDRLLEAMNRHDRIKDTKKLLAKLRSQVPGIVIRTTFIVGFPGETEEDFEELRAFVEEERFENAGVFTYSKEENTVAGEMPDQIDEETKERRYDELMALQASISEERHMEHEGRELEVLIEGYSDEGEHLAIARSYMQAPDIDGNIFVESAPGLEPGDFVKVRISEGFAYEEVAELIKD